MPPQAYFFLTTYYPINVALISLEGLASIFFTLYNLYVIIIHILIKASMGVFKGMQLAGLDRKSEVRQKKPGMLPIVPDQKRIPPILIEEAKNVLLEARREIAGVFADDQPSFFPELDDEPKIPADKAEAIVKKARTMIDDDTNVGFRIEDGQVKIVPEYKSVDVRKDIGY